MERVLWPMEPVEPRMASFFTSYFRRLEDGGEGRDAISSSLRRVWTSQPALDCAFEGWRGHCGALTTT